MRVSATAKYLRGSTRKANLVAATIRGRRVEEAASLLQFMPQHAARDNFVLHEYAEDLASYIFIRCHVIRPLLVWQRRSHKLNAAASRDWTYTRSSARRRGNPVTRRRNTTALP